MKRSKKELDNVIKSLKSQRERLPEYSFFGDHNWGRIDSDLYYVEHALNHNFNKDLDPEDDDYSYECHCWLEGEENEYYEDCMVEIE